MAVPAFAQFVQPRAINGELVVDAELGPFKTIAAAVEAATAGQTIHLVPGTYSATQLTLTGVRLAGASADLVTITGEMTDSDDSGGAAVGWIFKLASGAVLENVTINATLHATNNAWCDVVHLATTNTTVRNCVITATPNADADVKALVSLSSATVADYENGSIRVTGNRLIGAASAANSVLAGFTVDTGADIDATCVLDVDGNEIGGNLTFGLAFFFKNQLICRASRNRIDIANTVDGEAAAGFYLPEGSNNGTDDGVRLTTQQNEISVATTGAGDAIAFALAPAAVTKLGTVTRSNFDYIKSLTSPAGEVYDVRYIAAGSPGTDGTLAGLTRVPELYLLGTNATRLAGVNTQSGSNYGIQMFVAPVAAAMWTPVDAAGVVTLDVAKGGAAKWTAAAAETVNLTGTQIAGQELTLLISDDDDAGDVPRVITFGTGFRSAGTLTGTEAKMAVIRFVSDGTNMYEVSRTENLTP